MPIPFLVPAGMMAVRVAGKWVLKKIAKRLARRTRLKPKTEKTLKKKAAKQGRKLQKKKAQEPVYNLREKMLRRDNRTMANIDPVNKKLTKTIRNLWNEKVIYNQQKSTTEMLRDYIRIKSSLKTL